jgi:hypothetical protein
MRQDIQINGKPHPIVIYEQAKSAAKRAIGILFRYE